MNTTSTRDYAEKYMAAGWKLCSLPHSSKSPNTPNWNTTPVELKTINGGGLGLLHALSGTCAIDLDDLHAASEWLSAKRVDLAALLAADDAVQIQSGKPNRGKLLYRLPEGVSPLPTHQHKTDGTMVIEFRCASLSGDSVQDVLPPSLHPDTKTAYQWAGAGDFSKLPELPAELLALWISLLNPSDQRGAGDIPDGNRNVALFKRGGDLARLGWMSQAIEAALQALNIAQCKPPLSRADVSTIAKSAAVGSKGAQDAAIDAQIDNHRNAPRPDPVCLYGLIGDVARAGAENTEANPFAIAANFIAYMSAAVGRGPFMAVGNTWHHCRAFTLHVGRSGRGRKGDAVSLVHRIDRALRDLVKDDEALHMLDVAPKVHGGGLSSREGLVFLIHDGYSEGKNDIPPIADKRLWVVESEFANILQQSKRDGNTLSPALRDCWDGVSLKPATKSNRLYCTDPHVCLSGAITPTELLSVMATKDLTNGFANRFLMFWAERTQIVPFSTSTPQDEVNRLASRVMDVLTFCGAQFYDEKKDSIEITMTAAAKAVYVKLYRGELNDSSAGERITALIERRAPMLLRLAMLFALCEMKSEVDEHHIKAALAWIRYSVDSIKFVFASAADEVIVAEVNDAAQKILDYLSKVGEASRKQLTVDCFQKHASKDRLDAALDELLSSNPPRITVESVPRQKGSPGSATKIYRVTAANSAKCANSEDSRGFTSDCDDANSCELSRTVDTEGPTVRTVRTVRNEQNGSQTRVNIDSSHGSHSSPAETENEASV